jgi:hypothetical protein
MCRFCGGDYIITSFKVEKGYVKDFQTIVPNPTKVLNIIQCNKMILPIQIFKLFIYNDFNSLFNATNLNFISYK